MAHNRSASLEYVTFTGQVHLCSRYLTADIRDALDYEPCERCRLRGGRCARCKALRTGGGYIILDETELTDDEKLRRFGRRESACCHDAFLNAVDVHTVCPEPSLVEWNWDRRVWKQTYTFREILCLCS